MILYEGGEDIPTRSFNSSAVYCIESTHETNNCGTLTVIAQEDRYYAYISRGCPAKSYTYFIGQFEDGTKVTVDASSFRSGGINNPNKPTVYNIGFQGQGIWKVSVEGKSTREYTLWRGMFQRCYSEEYHKVFPTYRTCTVDERWHNFQNFCEDIQHLNKYQEWMYRNNNPYPYALDKDVKVKGNKLYSKDTCQFMTSRENNGRHNKKQRLTGLTYIATRLSEEHTEEFTNQTEFAEKYNLDRLYVSKCVTGKIGFHSGWIFKIKEEA